MASFVYNSFWEDLARGAIDMDTDTFRMMLVTSSYTPDQDAHLKRSSITNEVSGTGYTAKGPTCACTVAKDTVTNRVTFTFAGISLPTSTITARRGIIYKDRGGANTADELVMLNDFGADIVTTAQTFVVQASVITLQNASA
jgi:hypothetical protein